MTHPLQSKSTLALLADPTLMRLVPSIELCFLGMFVHIIACSWVMAELTDSATMVALVQTVTTLPPVLFSLVAGGIADVFDRRRVMILAQVSMFLVSLILVFMASFGLLTPISLLLLAFFVTAGNAALVPAWMASLGDIAPRDQRAEALSLHMISANIMKTTGPVLGGLLIATVGIAATFVVGSLSYVPAIIALFFWKPAPRERRPDASVGKAMTEGLRYLARARHVHPVVQRVFLFGLCFNGIIALLPLIARDQLSGEANVYGTLYGGIGFGAITGGLIMSRLRRAFGVERVVTGVVAMNAAAIMVLAFAHTPWLGFVACFVAGISWLISQTLLNATLQLASPSRLVGRMAAMHLTFTYLGLSLGSWIWGAVADHVGTQNALVLSGITMGGTALLGLWRKLPDISGPDPEAQPTPDL